MGNVFLLDEKLDEKIITCVIVFCSVGIVNTIAQSITKWRRSTDGKTGNVSNLSQASVSSDYSQVSTKCNKSTVINEVSVDLTAATPVVMRKRKASGDVAAFSTSKK